jgi:hypothetical protein
MVELRRARISFAEPNARSSRFSIPIRRSRDMKTLGAVVAVGLALMGSASAQSYGERDYGSRDRGSRYEERDRDYGDRGGYEDRGRGRAERGGGGFDEREYLRCNADVRRAVEQGKMPSGAIHYRNFGRREGRRLSC